MCTRLFFARIASCLFQITEAMYPGLPWALVFAAHGNVKHHLAKLKADGVAAQSHVLGLWALATRPP